ncbi:MAG: VCBS repeat-containing protein, partial [Verrucomicrobiaceae bacterium]
MTEKGLTHHHARPGAEMVTATSAPGKRIGCRGQMGFRFLNMSFYQVFAGWCVAGAVVAVAAAAPEVEFRPLPQLMVGDQVERPLPRGFASTSLLPWDGPGKPPVLLVTNHGAYFKERSWVYRATEHAGPATAFSLPRGYPVWKGAPFASLFAEKEVALEPARYLPVRREDGLFDLIHAERLDYHRNTGEPGAPKFRRDHTIRETDARGEGSRIWIDDLDGDAIPDLLIAGLTRWSDRFAQYPDHPAEKGPWSGREHPNMGSLPDTDIRNFRGYDIAGNWMGLPVRKYLWWARGSRDGNGHLSFGPHKHVRHGETDYPVQWQNMGDGMSPAVMELESGRFIVLLAGPDEILALPLRGIRDGELHTGKALPFLKDGGRLRTANLAQVVGIGDLNGDGRDEMVIGSGANGRFTVLSGSRAGDMEEMGTLSSLGGGVAGDTLAVPVRTDWDGDGHPDVIVGDASGMLSFWKGTADPLRYASCEFFHTASGEIRHRPVDGNLQGEVEAAWSYIQPEVADWDNDGHPDLITNDNEAKLFLYRGTGSGTLLHGRERFMLGEKPLPLAWRSRPAVLDGRHGLAGKDRPCLLFMTWDGQLAYAVPEARGSLNMERVTALTYESGQPILLAGPAGLSGRIKFSVTDWDGDGTWDLLAGVQHGLQRAFRTPGTESPSSAPYWLRNAGTASRPLFEPARMITFRDGTPIRVKSHSFDVFPTDLDADGKPDLIFGDDEGFIFHLSRDLLKWDEPVAEIRRAMFREAQILSEKIPLTPGVICQETWAYPAGPITPAGMAGGTG